MKKSYSLLAAVLFGVVANASMAAVAIKKAAPVATQESATSSTAASLVPSVLTLVSDVQALSAKQRELEADCIPSSAEISFVNNTIKEWAKTGEMTADEVASKLGKQRCPSGTCYRNEIMDAAGTGMDVEYFDSFSGTDDEYMIWQDFPKATVVEYCSDGSYGNTCSKKDRKTASNIYEIFNLIDFDEVDYTRQDNSAMVSKLLAKASNCADNKVEQRKKQVMGEFLVGAVGKVGQKTSTATIMETVSNITKNGTSLNGGLSSLGTIASQFMDK